MTTMRKILATAMAALLTTGLTFTGALVIGSTGVAHAQTTPPWETGGSGGGPVDTNEVGGLIFYNVSGTQITGGSVSGSDAFGAFVQGTTILNANDKKATLFAFSPVNGQPPGSWNNDQLSSSTLYPVSSPSDLASSTLPVVSGSTTSLAFTDYESEFPEHGHLHDRRIRRCVSAAPV